MNWWIPAVFMVGMAVLATEVMAADAMRERVAAADRSYEASDFKTALTQSAEIKSAATNDGKVLLHCTARMAECQYHLGRHNDALQSYEELLTKWPHGSRRYFPDLHRADCLLIAGRTNAAVRAYDLVNKEYPTNYHVNVQSRIEEIKKQSPNQRRDRTGDSRTVHPSGQP